MDRYDDDMEMDQVHFKEMPRKSRQDSDLPPAIIKDTSSEERGEQGQHGQNDGVERSEAQK